MWSRWGGSQVPARAQRSDRREGAQCLQVQSWPVACGQWWALGITELFRLEETFKGHVSTVSGRIFN